MQKPWIQALLLLGVLLLLAREWRARRRAQAALRALQDLLGATPLALLAWTPRRGVLAWNVAAEYLFGLPRTAVAARALPEALQPLQAAADDALAGVQTAVALPVAVCNARGERLDLSVSVARFGDLHGDAGCIALVEDQTSQRRREARQFDLLRAQREALVREVHHRIKNHLQGVAGLLRQHLAGKPSLAPLLEAASTQVLSIAAVHGLQGEAEGDGALDLQHLLQRIAASISGIMPAPIALGASCGVLRGMQVSEEEAVPVAMVLNELLMNAAKHGARGAGPIEVEAVRFGAQVAINVGNDGVLPPRFDFEQGRHIGTGLGLVRSLLPSRGARLSIEERGERVVATLMLGPPHVTPAPSPAAPQEQRA